MAITPEKIQTLHPAGKKAPRITVEKYEMMHAAISEVLSEHAEINFTDALHEVERKLGGRFPGKVAWYYVTVKMDMEAKGQLRSSVAQGKQMIRKA